MCIKNTVSENIVLDCRRKLSAEKHLKGGDFLLIVLIRAVILYVLITFSLRLMGKRQIGELQPSELVVTILVSNIASLPIEDSSIPMIMGIIPVLTLVCLDVFASALMLKSVRFRRLVTGNPIIIISDGKINQRMLKNLRYSVDDVIEAMRQCMIFDISEVQYAIVETNGQINFYQKYQYRNVTNEDIGKSSDSVNPPSIVIRDGIVNEKGLLECALSVEWLERTLKDEGLSTRRVFLMTADKNGKHTIVQKEMK